MLALQYTISGHPSAKFVGAGQRGCPGLHEFVMVVRAAESNGVLKCVHLARIGSLGGSSR